MSNYPPGTPDLMGALADDGLSDFCQDYIPDDDQLAGWFTDDPDGAVEAIRNQLNGNGILWAAWQETHQDDIEKEWDDTHEPQGEYE